MMARGLRAGLVSVALVACGSKVAFVDGTGGGRGGAPPGTTSTTQSTAAGTTSTTGSGAGEECCTDTEVYRDHNCLPTTELGCGASCSEGSCAEGWRCDDCAASGPCLEEICHATCVLDQGGPMGEIREGDLRIAPTRVDVGQPTQVSVRGVPLYVGALWYGVRVGTESEHTLEGVDGGPCEQSFLSDALAAGTYPVWVSQYGGATPWVLAGILTVGEMAPSCSQPGYACAAPGECCQAPGATVDCDQGYCLRNLE